jgi:hypothetical protein
MIVYPKSKINTMTNITKKLKIIFEYEVNHSGWDIPTRLILDSNEHIWMDNAHGSVKFEGKMDCGHYTEWLQDYGNEPEYADVVASIHKFFNLKPRMPGWMVTALDSGWSPPESFNRNDYFE